MTKTRRIGTDRVILDGDRLVVISRATMDGWDARRYRPSVIRFDGRTWRVTGTSTGDAGTIHYELAPWQPGEQELTGREIDYHQDFVALRDRSRTLDRRRGRIVLLLRALSPLVGFLPARTKGHLEAVYGVDPVATTFHSVFLELLITLGAFALASIGQLIFAHSGTRAGFPVAILAVTGVVSGLDGAMRYSRILSEERPPPGFYEWLVRRAPRP